MYRVAGHLDEPTTNDESGPIESVVTVYTDFGVGITLCARLGDTLIYDGDETTNFVFAGGNLGSGRVFVVGGAGVLEGGRVVGRFDAMGHVDDVADIGVLTEQLEGGMYWVGLAQSQRLARRAGK